MTVPDVSPARFLHILTEVSKRLAVFRDAKKQEYGVASALTPNVGSPEPSPGRKRGPSLIVKLFVAACASAVALGTCEIVLRSFWENPYANEGTAQFVKLRIQPPNMNLRVNRDQIDPELKEVWLRTDQRSYIRPSFESVKPQATIAFLGGSTTECMAVEESLRFPALVATMFAAHGIEVNTLNAGCSGNTLHDSLNILVNHVAEDHPDFVVVMNVTNDLGVLDVDGSYRSRQAHALRLAQVFEFVKLGLSRKSALFGLARRAFSGVKAEVNDPSRLRWRNDPDRAAKIIDQQYRARLRAFVGACRGFGMEPVLMTQPLSGAKNELTPKWSDIGGQDRFNFIVREVGGQMNVLVIDLAHHLAESIPDWDEPGRIFYDGMHVNEVGSRVYAEHIFEQLFPLVEPHDATPSQLAPPRNDLDASVK